MGAPKITGRRNRRLGTLYNAEVIAPLLSKEKPFFTMQSGGAYGCVIRDGKPTGQFVRIDYDHRPVKQRKKERRAMRKIQQAMSELEKEQKNVLPENS